MADKTLLLAIDTAGADCAAGLYDMASGRMLAQASEEVGKGHAEKLMAAVDAVLEKAGRAIADIGRVAVTIGPGSFTGIRVGVAAARGFGLALACPVVGVTALEVIAAAARANRPDGNILAAMDAKRGEIYAQVFGPDNQPATPPIVLTPEATAALADLHKAEIAGSGRGPILGEQTGRDVFPIGMIATIAAGRDPEAHPAKPLYLRGPGAKQQTGFAVARA